MALTRRKFLTQSGLAAAGTLLASCAPARDIIVGQRPVEQWPVRNDQDWHALQRLTFGPRADERAHVAEIGLDGWIEAQLAPESLDDWVAAWRVQRFDTLTMDTSVIFDVRAEYVRRELQQATLLRAIYSRRQLYEVMVEFWSDHFNISTLKGDCAWLKPIDDRDVIRPHALGNFRDLLWASLHSPAMLVYLDNQENHAGSPNENYARELLELHTLGVAAGYTQRDVQEVARCLTGWSVDDMVARGEFRFVPEQHDDGIKTVLGRTIPAGGGAKDVDQVFAAILDHPELPHFIATKLVRRLVADEPPAALVAAAAQTFAHTDGDIKATLRTILHAGEFAAAPPKFKRPFRYIAGALRQLNAETDAGQPILNGLARMGQPLFVWATPDGYPDTADVWRTNLLPRWQFADRLAQGNLPETTLDLDGLLLAAGADSVAAALDQFSTLLLGRPLPDPQREDILRVVGRDLGREQVQLIVALLLAAPAYQWS